MKKFKTIDESRMVLVSPNHIHKCATWCKLSFTGKWDVVAFKKDNYEHGTRLDCEYLNVYINNGAETDEYFNLENKRNIWARFVFENSKDAVFFKMACSTALLS